MCHTAAILALPYMVTVAEIERVLVVCVNLTTIPFNATLANEAVVSLFTVDGTGIIIITVIVMLVIKFCHLLTASADDGDFIMISVTLTFAPNSSSGAEMCTSVTILFDNMMEENELFTVSLSLETVTDSLRLGNDLTEVNLTDPTCTYVVTHTHF